MPWRTGDIVEARREAQFHGEEMPWHVCRGQAAHMGGRCDVLYRDGTRESLVPFKFLRAYNGPVPEEFAAIVADAQAPMLASHAVQTYAPLVSALPMATSSSIASALPTAAAIPVPAPVPVVPVPAPVPVVHPSSSAVPISAPRTSAPCPNPVPMAASTYTPLACDAPCLRCTRPARH